jgi:hypothetical protein
MSKQRIAQFVTVALLSTALVWRVVGLPASDNPLTVHEWGTFTALQDDNGRAMGAINSDDEPVPPFVCATSHFWNTSAQTPLTPGLAGKGIMPCHPDVTMRLETPVIYFYPPAGHQAAPLNVQVTFHGGWLTEFYPLAAVEAPDLLNSQSAYPPLTAATNGSLAWKGVQLGASGALTATDDPVWTAPREVARAAVVKVPSPNGSAEDPRTRPEKFLFYRGVGHINSPLRAVRDPQTDQLSLYADLSAIDRASRGPGAGELWVPAAWLIEIRPGDGFCAFRPITGALDLDAPTDQPLATFPAGFAPADFSAGRLQALHAAMHGALVSAGLFPDEATAMLKTWELSYFKSPGRRLFYMTPRAWTDQVLPLTIPGAKITRAMVGRIELVTPGERESLARIAAGPCPDMSQFPQAYFTSLNRFTGDASSPAGQALRRSATLAELKVPVPAVYQDFLDLGRFRDALVLNEEKRHPTEALAAFIASNRLQAR